MVLARERQPTSQIGAPEQVTVITALNALIANVKAVDVRCADEVLGDSNVRPRALGVRPLHELARQLPEPRKRVSPLWWLLRGRRS